MQLQTMQETFQALHTAQQALARMKDEHSGLAGQLVETADSASKEKTAGGNFADRVRAWTEGTTPQLVAMEELTQSAVHQIGGRAQARVAAAIRRAGIGDDWSQDAKMVGAQDAQSRAWSAAVETPSSANVQSYAAALAAWEKTALATIKRTAKKQRARDRKNSRRFR